MALHFDHCVRLMKTFLSVVCAFEVEFMSRFGIFAGETGHLSVSDMNRHQRNVIDWFITRCIEQNEKGKKAKKPPPHLKKKKGSGP